LWNARRRVPRSGWEISPTVQAGAQAKVIGKARLPSRFPVSDLLSASITDVGNAAGLGSRCSGLRHQVRALTRPAAIPPAKQSRPCAAMPTSCIPQVSPGWLCPTVRSFTRSRRGLAVATRQALNGAQVRDTEGSGTITLQSEWARGTIDSYFDLVARNPGRAVSLHYITTSAIGLEREKAHRIDGRPALDYWRRAAAGAELAPLRTLIVQAG